MDSFSFFCAATRLLFPDKSSIARSSLAFFSGSTGSQMKFMSQGTRPVLLKNPFLAVTLVTFVDTLRWPYLLRVNV